MQIVQATFRDGVFAPDQTVTINEGARVTLRIQPAKNSSGPMDVPAEPVIESDEEGAPFDLPMPVGGIRVGCHDGLTLLPDAPQFYNSSTTE